MPYGDMRNNMNKASVGEPVDGKFLLKTIDEKVLVFGLKRKTIVSGQL